ncbi:MAG: hypothetical protein JRM99_00665 [Nitrososphaerota archaeon]|nr:hypothetical protein [Nitrososphaerota archaeon]
MVNAYFFPNSVLNILGGLVALAVSYYAYRYGRITGSGFLRTLSIGFMMLGVGLLAQASAFIFFALEAGRIADRGTFVYSATLVYLALQAVAYLMIAVSYSRRVQGGPKLAAGAAAVVTISVASTPSSLLLFGTHVLEFGELILVVLVALIVFQGLLIYGENRNRLALTVMGAFALILLAHIAELSASLLSSGLLYLVGDLVQLAGFGLLLLFVLRSGPDGGN